jgi:WD40 repeat protein
LAAFSQPLTNALKFPLAVDFRRFDPRIDEFDASRWESAWMSLLANLLDVDRATVEDREQKRWRRDRTQQARLLWLEATRDRESGREDESILRLALACERAPVGSLKQNLSRAMKSEFPHAIVHSIWEGHERLVGATLSPDGRHLAVWDDRDRVSGIDVGEARSVLPEISHDARINGISFLSATVASSFDQNGMVKIFDFAQGAERACLRNPGLVAWVGPGPADHLVWVAHGGAGGLAYALWDWHAGNLLSEQDERVAHVTGGLVVQDGKLIEPTGPGVFREVEVPGRALEHWSLSDGSAVVLCDQTVVTIRRGADQAYAVTERLDFDAAVANGAFAPVSKWLFCQSSRGFMIADLSRRECHVVDGIHGGQLTVSPNESVVVVMGEETVSVLSATGEILWSMPAHIPSGITFGGIYLHWDISAIAFHEEDRKKVTLRSLADGSLLSHPLRHPAPINRYFYSSSERLAITLGGDRRVLFWRFRSREDTLPFVVWRRVAHLVETYEAPRIAFRDARGFLQVMDPFDGKLVGPPVHATDDVDSLAITRDDASIVGYSADNRLFRYRLEGERATKQSLIFGFKGIITGAVLSPAGFENAVCLQDGSVHLVDLTGDLEVKGSFQHRGMKQRLGLEYSADGTRIVTWSSDEQVRIWDAASQSEICAPVETGSLPLRACFDVTGNRVLVATSENECIVRDLARDREIRIKQHGYSTVREIGLPATSFSRNGELVISASNDRTIRVFDSETGEQVIPPLEHRGTVNWFSNSYDDRRFLSSSEDRVSIWDLRTGKRAIRDIVHPSHVCGVFWSFDEDCAVSWDERNVIRLWDTNTGLPVSRELQHRGARPIQRTTLSRDGRRLMAYSDDRTVSVWILDNAEPENRWRDLVELCTATQLDSELLETSGLGAEDLAVRRTSLGVGPPTRVPKPEVSAHIPAWTARYGIVPSGPVSESEARAMIRDHDVYERRWNPGARERPFAVMMMGEEVVGDPLTSLFWQRSGTAEPIEAGRVRDAIEALNEQHFGGCSDWRLPTLEEAMSLLQPGKTEDTLHIPREFDRRQTKIWTMDIADSGRAWTVNYADGVCTTQDFDQTAFVRAVRWQPL